jgi:hypothetical protein
MMTQSLTAFTRCDFDRRAERLVTRASVAVNGINNPLEMR